jgi:hypothetical protein
MSFKVKDLSISLSSEGGSTCTTLTKPTGDCLASTFWQQESAARRQNLTVLKAQLRNATTRA